MVVFQYLKQVGAQTSIKTVRFNDINDPAYLRMMVPNQVTRISESWNSVKEPIGVWSNSNFTFHGILEHLNVTKDRSDYLWYTTRYLKY